MPIANLEGRHLDRLRQSRHRQDRAAGPGDRRRPVARRAQRFDRAFARGWQAQQGQRQDRSDDRRDVVVSDGKDQDPGARYRAAGMRASAIWCWSAEAGRTAVVKVDKLAATGTDIEPSATVASGFTTAGRTRPPTCSSASSSPTPTGGKNDLAKTLLGAPGSTSPALIDTYTGEACRAKRADNFYGFHAYGPPARRGSIRRPRGSTSLARSRRASAGW